MMSSLFSGGGSYHKVHTVAVCKRLAFYAASVIGTGSRTCVLPSITSSTVDAFYFVKPIAQKTQLLSCPTVSYTEVEPFGKTQQNVTILNPR